MSTAARVECVKFPGYYETKMRQLSTGIKPFNMDGPLILWIFQ